MVVVMITVNPDMVVNGGHDDHYEPCHGGHWWS